MQSTTIEKNTAADISDDFPLFGQLQSYEHEQIVICSEPSIGLKAIIAVHDTTLGPALGGVRMWPYNNEQYSRCTSSFSRDDLQSCYFGIKPRRR